MSRGRTLRDCGCLGRFRKPRDAQLPKVPEAPRSEDRTPARPCIDRLEWRRQRQLAGVYDDGAGSYLCRAIHKEIEGDARSILEWVVRAPRAQVLPQRSLHLVRPVLADPPRSRLSYIGDYPPWWPRTGTVMLNPPHLHARLVLQSSPGWLAWWRWSQREEAIAHNSVCRRQLGSNLVSHSVAARMSCQLPEKHYLESDCGKLARLRVLLRDCQTRGCKCIIFTQFSKMLDVLEAFVNYNSFTYLRLDGTVKVDRRQELVNRFNADDRIFLFISSTRAGGVGINLVGANVVIFYDSDWNPAMDRQATDRAHRIGQTREVHIYRLISEHTVEENMWKRQLQKRQLDDVVVDQGQFNVETLKDHSRTSAVWSCAEVRSVLTGENDEMAASAEDSTMTSTEFERILHSVEDAVDAAMATTAGREQRETEKALARDFAEKADADAMATAAGREQREMKAVAHDFGEEADAYGEIDASKALEANKIHDAGRAFEPGKALEAIKVPDSVGASGDDNWFEALPPLVRWGALRVRILGLEDLIGQRAQRGRRRFR